MQLTHPLQCHSYRLEEQRCNIQTVNGAIVNALRPFLYESTEREPIIIPMILTPDDENKKQPVETTVSTGFIVTFEDQRDGTEIGNSLNSVRRPTSAQLSRL